MKVKRKFHAKKVLQLDDFHGSLCVTVILGLRQDIGFQLRKVSLYTSNTFLFLTYTQDMWSLRWEATSSFKIGVPKCSYLNCIIKIIFMH